MSRSKPSASLARTRPCLCFVRVAPVATDGPAAATIVFRKSSSSSSDFEWDDGGFGGGLPALLGPELPVVVLINLGGRPMSPLDFGGGAAATGLVWFRDIRIPLASISIYFLKTELPLRKFKISKALDGFDLVFDLENDFSNQENHNANLSLSSKF